VKGINDRIQLAEAEVVLRERILRQHMFNGVTVVDLRSTYIDAGVAIGQDTTIEPGTQLRGTTTVGVGCVIGPAAVVVDSRIGDRCVVRSSTIEDAVLEPGVDIGPYSHLRA